MLLFTAYIFSSCACCCFHTWTLLCKIKVCMYGTQLFDSGRLFKLLEVCILFVHLSFQYFVHTVIYVKEVSVVFGPRSLKMGLKSLGSIRATGKEVRDNHRALHLTVLPGADTSYRQRSDGRSLCPPFDCPTSGRYELQAKK